MIKYLFWNDISYLFHKRKKILILLILPILFILLNAIGNISASNIFHLSMGTNIILENYMSIDLLIYLFTICFNLFLIVDVYIKDIEYQLDFIFLRVDPAKWFVQKSLVFIFIIFVIRMIQYLLAIFILLSKGYQIVMMNYVYLLITDYFYILLLQYLFFSLYIIGKIFKKFQGWIYVIFFVIFCFIPKSILSLEHYVLFVMLAVIGLLVLNIWMVKKFHKRIIENL